MQAIPLLDEHRRAGARLVTVDDWLVPESYGDVPAEYAALRTGAAVIDLSLRRILRLSGGDRASFLHNMVTNDINALRPGEGCNAALLSLQGKMLAGMRVHCLADALWCDVDPGPSARVRDALDKHLIMEDVTIEDLTTQWCILAVQGPQAEAVLARVSAGSALPQSPLSHTWGEIDGITVRYARVDHCGAGGFDLWVPAADATKVWDALHNNGARATGLAALDVRRIEAGIPWAGFEIDGEHFPMEAGLDAEWISYSKGCYLGQETISRLHHLGHVNRTLRGILLAKGNVVPDRGAALWDGDKRAGAVTSATVSPHLGHPVALAYLHRDHATPGQTLALEHSGDRVSVQVAALPLA